MALNLEPWEHNILGIYDISSRPVGGPSRHWFNFVEKASDVDGDFLEFGVYRGRSLVSTALLLQERETRATAVGFDTFEGFPSYSSYDDQDRFEQLLEEGRPRDPFFRGKLMRRTRNPARTSCRRGILVAMGNVNDNGLAPHVISPPADKAEPNV